MSYFIVPTDSCVFLACEGDLTLTEMTTAWREVQAMLNETKWQRVLADVTTMNTRPETEELFDLAKLFWRNFPPGGRMALVVRWDQTGFAKSLEMLVRNFGVHLTVFVSVEQAEAWVFGASRGKEAVQEFTN